MLRSKSNDVYKYAHKYGISHFCCNYVTCNLQGRTYTDKYLYRDLTWPLNAEVDEYIDNCNAVDYTHF